MELSRPNWLITSLSPGQGEKMSRRSLAAGDIAGLKSLLDQLMDRALRQTGHSYPYISIQEAGTIGVSWRRASRATLLIRHRWRLLGDGAARKRTGSTAKRCC
jgi:hypothetical protein